MMNQVTDAETANSRWRWLYKVGSASALVLLLLFLSGVISILNIVNGWLTPFLDNWLVVLFKVNAGFSGAQLGLTSFNLLDLFIMALFSVMFLALCFALRRTSKSWSLVGAAFPFMGIPVFLITGTAGRSALLIGALIMSVGTLRSKFFGKVNAYVGILASVLLFFAGDIATAVFSTSNVIAIFIGTGYVLWMVWFFQIARRLFQLR